MDFSCKDIREHCLRTLTDVGAPTELCNFYADVVQCEYDITRTIYRLQHDLRGDVIDGRTSLSLSMATDGHLAPAELFGIQQNLIKHFNGWRTTVDRLVEQQPNVPPFRICLNDITNNSEVFKVKAGCSLETDQVVLHEGEDLVVTDTSQPNLLRVRNSNGDEGYVPALSCILPTPDDSTLTAVERLQILLLTSWAECVRKVRLLLAATMSHSVKQLTNGWNSWVNGRQYRGSVGRYLQKLVDGVSSTKWQASAEMVRIHRQLGFIESELLGFNASSNGLMSMRETVANLDKALLCYQVFNKQWRHFRQGLVRAPRPIRLVEEWEQLRQARRCNHFKYYELKMTVEEHEELEELTYVGEALDNSSGGGSRTSKESVEADKMTAVKQEERKRFLIRSVVDPRTGDKISLREAVAAGIIDYRKGHYVNPDTGDGVTISEAMTSGAIAVDYTAVHRSTPITDVVSLLTVRRLIVDDAYRVTEALDAETALRVPVSEAVRRGIIDPAGNDGDGEYVNTLTGARLPLDEAIQDGWVFAEFEGGVPRYSTVTHEVVGVVDRGGRSSRSYSLSSGYPLGGGARLVTFTEAIRTRLLDPRTGDYVDSATGRRIYVADAIRQGLIKTKLVGSGGNVPDPSTPRRGPILPHIPGDVCAAEAIENVAL